MKIPIGSLLDKLGLRDLVIEKPEDLAKFNQMLDEAISQAEQEEKGKNK